VASDAPKASRVEEGNAPKPKRKTLVFFGDSLTAGYGLDIAAAYPSLLQQRIDMKVLPPH